jgi:uncharacterized membrane protein YsdA (DUF1294 family)
LIKKILIIFASVFIGILWLAYLTHYTFIYVPSYVSGLSTLTFLIYAWDKRKAKQSTHKKVNRISERTLQLFALFGGWPGALIAQQILRHKSQKQRFIIVLWVCILINLSVIGFLGYVLLVRN